MNGSKVKSVACDRRTSVSSPPLEGHVSDVTNGGEEGSIQLSIHPPSLALSSCTPLLILPFAIYSHISPCFFFFLTFSLELSSISLSLSFHVRFFSVSFFLLLKFYHSLCFLVSRKCFFRVSFSFFI